MSAQLDSILTSAGERPSSLSETLDDIEKLLSRFIAYPCEHTKVAHILWIAHTHCMDEWDSTPRILFCSAEPGSGKSRVLEVTESLVPRPLSSVNATSAYLFRKVSDEDGLPTILYDEIDTIFGPKAKDNEEVRGFLNAGHRRGACAGRCVVSGSTVKTEELPAYCAVAMFGLAGKVPDTILTRSIIVHMRRRGPNEHIEPYRMRIHSVEGHPLRDRLATWAADFRLDDNYPEMPPGVEDRAADVWEPLLVIADAAGGHWKSRSRAAAIALVAIASETAESFGVRLLEDLHIVFKGESELQTKTIIEHLCELEEAPWGDLYGQHITPRGLAKILKPYGIKSKNISIGTARPKGYSAADIKDSWERYLPQSEKKPLQPLPVGTAGDVAATQSATVADKSATSKVPATTKPLHSTNVAEVAEVARGEGSLTI